VSTSADGRSVWTEEQFDASLANMLRAGVVLSAVVVLGGAVVFLTQYGADTPDYRVFRGAPDRLRSIGGIISVAAGLSGSGLIQLGLLLLIATPIARVMLSIVGFAKSRDWLYVVITMTVLALLTYSLTTG
jgi:uncharacterized membrane protein